MVTQRGRHCYVRIVPISFQTFVESFFNSDFFIIFSEYRTLWTLCSVTNVIYLDFIVSKDFNKCSIRLNRGQCQQACQIRYFAFTLICTIFTSI